MKPTLRITNSTRGSILATQAQIATTPETRRIGLIGVTEAEFPPGTGLFFPECNAIHTLEMSMIIDVLFIDMLKSRVQKAVRAAVPDCHFNTLVPKEICAVLELPAGTLEATGTLPGDVIVILSSTHAPQDELNQLGRL
jgi:uncharacterized membrane protein (UPF0127 family)